MPLAVRATLVTPHVGPTTLRFTRQVPPPEGALIRFFVAGPVTRKDIRFGGRSARELLAAGDWSWCDFPGDEPGADRPVRADGLTVLTCNTSGGPWRPGATVTFDGGPSIPLVPDPIRLSAVTFLGSGDSPYPDRIVVHFQNGGSSPVRPVDVRLWLPADPRVPPHLAAGRSYPLVPFGDPATIPPNDTGGGTAQTGSLPLATAAIEVRYRTGAPEALQSVFAHVRIRRARVDISGGWVGERYLSEERFLKTLKRLHIDTAHIESAPGYTDTELYTRYPLRYFHGYDDLAAFDNDRILSRIHAAEFLGEPQYNGGRPVRPVQEIWQALQRYTPSRIASTITLSDASFWHRYAGISDFPHFDAYRVTAPAADSFRRYPWPGGISIGWGAPLETIGEMTRLLRNLFRPNPIAVWSQGPHDGWDGEGRPRSSPTPDELRSQAWYALAARATSLYWFNLSPQSLVKFRDTLTPLTRIGRELRLIDDLLLQGDAISWDRQGDWEASVVAGPAGALLVALDRCYRPDPQSRTFVFEPPRPLTLRFALPAYARRVADVFRIDADGVHTIAWKRVDGVGVQLTDQGQVVRTYVATGDRGLRARLARRHRALLARERESGFDPADSDADFAALAAIAAR
jgi:hypothetical protein